MAEVFSWYTEREHNVKNNVDTVNSHDSSMQPRVYLQLYHGLDGFRGDILVWQRFTLSRVSHANKIISWPF